MDLDMNYRLSAIERKAVIEKLADIGVHVRADVPILELSQVVRKFISGGQPYGVSNSDMLRRFIEERKGVPKMELPHWKEYVVPQSMHDAVAKALEYKRIPSLYGRKS